MNGLPGDIDLTENLDFRKVVKRKLPQLPDSWKGDKNKLIVSDNINITWTINTTSSYISTLNSNTYDLTSITSTSDSFNITDWNNDSIGELENIHIESDRTSFTYRINSTNTYTTNMYYYDTNGNSWSSQSSKIASIEFKEKKDKYDVFGNKIVPPKEIPRIPWEGKENKWRHTNKRIAWKNNMYHDRFSLRNDYNDCIPWKIERISKRYDLYDTIERARYLICWLFDKSRNNIRKYFETEDDVDLSYLTNMGWIRVHDAVIDSI